MDTLVVQSRSPSYCKAKLHKHGILLALCLDYLCITSSAENNYYIRKISQKISSLQRQLPLIAHH